MGQIRSRIEAAYASIRKDEEEIAACRKECQHPVHKKGFYSWRVGCIDPAMLCEDCDAFIKYLDEEVNVTGGKMTTTNGDVQVITVGNPVYKKTFTF